MSDILTGLCGVWRDMVAGLDRTQEISTMSHIAKVQLLVLATLLWIGGCASELSWTKAGVSAEQLESDKARCTVEEIRGSRRTGAYRVKVVKPDCMEALGYIRM